MSDTETSFMKDLGVMDEMMGISHDEVKIRIPTGKDTKQVIDRAIMFWNALGGDPMLKQIRFANDDMLICVRKDKSGSDIFDKYIVELNIPKEGYTVNDVGNFIVPVIKSHRGDENA